MSDTNSFRTLIEKVAAETEVYKIKLPVSESSLKGVLSKEALKLHYGTLYGNYVKKALDGEGEFQVAGAKLHTLFFEQFQAPQSRNTPTGLAEILINNKFGSFDEFKDSFTETAMGIHGSGWVYLSISGTLKTISNHKNVDDVLILIDCWEHSWLLDYGTDKEKYLNEMWKIINWEVINRRL